MESDIIIINQNKNKLKKSFKSKIQFKNIIINIILFLYFIFTTFFFFINIGNRDLLKQLLKNGGNNINETSIYNISSKNKDIQYRINLLRKFTNNNPFIYKHMEDCLLNNTDNLLCFYPFLYTKRVIGKNRIFLGEKFDGSYVLLDDFENIRIAYSFGISNMVQFDAELAKRGIDVYMYDHTIDSLPYNNTKFHWSKIGICGNNERTEILKTLDDLIKLNGHTFEKNMLLKIDVEGWEWNSMNDLSEDILRQFKYILIEYHFFDPLKEELYYNVIKKIHKSHQPFYFRCQDRPNIAPIRNRICRFLEVSYIIREGNKFDKDDSIYPIFEFDYTGPYNYNLSECNLNIIKLFDFDE